MTYSEKYLKAAHVHCTTNKTEIATSIICGCFYCLETYPPNQIERWLEGEDTALCAECQIDSVIGDASGLPVSDPAFLTAMQRAWFGRSGSVASKTTQKTKLNGLFGLFRPKDNFRA